MELKIFIRQFIDTDPINGQQFYYNGLNPRSLTKVFGTLPASRQWRDFSGNRYINITDKISDLHQLTLTWSANMDSSGNAVPGGLFAKKSASGGLIVEGEGYNLIKKWLVEDISAPLNIIQVLVEHVGCGKYEDYVIKATDIEVCDDDNCSLTITLKQKDDAFTCIQNTLITDNWQDWFPVSGRPATKRHPRFSYCNEAKPNGILITIWWMLVNLQSALVPLVITFALAINPIIAIIKLIIDAINAVIRIVGGNEIEDKMEFITLSNIKDAFGAFYIEIAGCGREHPAPRIRDYITNVCDKCGVTVSSDTAPIFFAQSIKIETSTDRDLKREPVYRDNPHYNACYFSGTKERGIRRFENPLNLFTGGTINTTDWWINGNAPFMTLDTFLDNLKGLYNLDWRVTDNVLYINRKDFWIDSDYVFDFEGKDKALIIEGICYNWTGENYPAIIKGIYTPDGGDSAGNEAQIQQDSIVGVGATVQNPLFKGILDKTTQFSAAKFRLDGASTDYVYDAMQQVLAGTTLTGQVWSTPTFQTISDYFKYYVDYGLLLTEEASTLPKVLLWDGVSLLNAKCVKPYAAHPAAGTIPSTNIRYNNNPTQQWDIKHEPKTRVLGRRIFAPAPRDGYYDVRGILGAGIVQQPAMLVNYPMYFESGYEGTLWDWFHWIDDPLLNPRLNKEWSLKMELCCETLDRLQPFNNGKDIKLGQKVKLPNKTDGKITEITVSYKTGEVMGMYIELKGIS